MHTIVIDTYDLIKELKEAGFDERQSNVNLYLMGVMFLSMRKSYI
jgi:hypothetical protein